ncbi:hypothetical protein LZ32DRAFT_229640 [Colletotrichum eremochloae]|nr:hypothetical protein LZ32DRAFT_229640 [Colletotrichum eremochloae]
MDHPGRNQQTPLSSVLRCSSHAPKRGPRKTTTERAHHVQRSPSRHYFCCTPLSLALLLSLSAFPLQRPPTERRRLA